MSAQQQEFTFDANALTGPAVDVVLAKNAAEVLNKHYPGHLWGINVDGSTGVMQVFNLALSGRWGFILKLDKIDPELKAVMRAGGELLERYRVKRGALNLDSIISLDRDFAGNKVFDRG